MRVLEVDERHARLSLVVETPEDLYYLMLLLRRGDVVYAWTTRQVKVEREAGSERGERVRVYAGVEVEKVSYSKFTKAMRVTGRVVEGPEDLHMKGSYHTLSIGVGDEVVVAKREGIGEFDREVLKRASSLIRRVLIISVGEDEVCVGELSTVGIHVKSCMQYSPRKSGRESSIREAFLEPIREKLELIKSSYPLVEYDEVLVLAPEKLLASVEEVLDELDLQARVIKVSEGGEAGIHELLRRPDLRQLFIEVRALAEAQEVTSLLEELFKGSRRVTVGLEAVEKASEWGVVEKIAVLDELFFDEATRERVLDALNKLPRVQVILVDSESEVGRTLRKLGGIIAQLYYALENT